MNALSNRGAAGADALRQEFEALRGYARGHEGPQFDPDVALHAVARARATWPPAASPWLRLAALAHGIDEELDAELAAAPGRLTHWDPAGPQLPRRAWAPDVPLTLAMLVLLEQLDYLALLAEPGNATPLRDALTGPEDRETLAATVRFDLALRDWATPDHYLSSWRHHVGFIERETANDYDNEFGNLLTFRDRLQDLSAVLTMSGQAEWRFLIDEVDEQFRAVTERAPVPLAVPHRAGWWRYRVPKGIGADRLMRELSSQNFVTADRPTEPGIRPTSEAWRLADRPNGVVALTDHELRRLLPFFRFQSEHEQQRSRPVDLGVRTWTSRYEAVRDELRRRETNRL